MIKIVDLVEHPEHVDTLVKWLEREWPDVAQDSFSRRQRLCGDLRKDNLPITLVALNNDTPVGFITMILHEPSAQTGRPFWIDAIVIDPNNRKKGLAQELLTAMEAVAKRLEISPVFALTDVPELYYKNKWIYIESNKEDPTVDVIVMKDLVDPILQN